MGGKEMCKEVGKGREVPSGDGELERDKAEKKGITIWGLADGGN